MVNSTVRVNMFGRIKVVTLEVGRTILSMEKVILNGQMEGTMSESIIYHSTKVFKWTKTWRRYLPV